MRFPFKVYFFIPPKINFNKTYHISLVKNFVVPFASVFIILNIEALFLINFDSPCTRLRFVFLHCAIAI